MRAGTALTSQGHSRSKCGNWDVHPGPPHSEAREWGVTPKCWSWVHGKAVVSPLGMDTEEDFGGGIDS